ncbi:hypothetical protein ACQPYK_22175 [Streptosporangium sp. CA-135522]|uniref:hypothetical protein n=1 Tax=Streptosporangium sp. CA-135522 TaxID=3240072 RepID=UPI003D8A1266
MGLPPLPKEFEVFFTFVRVLGADHDLDREPDLSAEKDGKRRWKRLHEAARDEAKQAAANGRARRREAHTSTPWPGRPRRRSGLWWTGGGLAGSVSVVIAIVVFSGGSKIPSVFTPSTCANVIDNRPAGVYPSPDAQTTPIRFKKRTDLIVVLDEPAAPAGWAKVFTPKDPPGFQWMLVRQLGPQRPC